jgi:hypothetical protein
MPIVARHRPEFSSSSSPARQEFQNLVRYFGLARLGAENLPKIDPRLPWTKVEGSRIPPTRHWRRWNVEMRRAIGI